jgi:CRISPR/Cas system CMR subunit Cmr4 (Cas7 group RAMP superfamily)
MPCVYFFGASGLEGYLRVPNFFPEPGEWRIDQTRIRIDRKSQTAATGAIVTGEQVKPGSVFKGEMLIFAERHGSRFGYCREIGGTKVDLWLDRWGESDDGKRSLFLINEILIPALNNVAVLGGQKSLGGGRVIISISRVAG